MKSGNTIEAQRQEELAKRMNKEVENLINRLQGKMSENAEKLSFDTTISFTEKIIDVAKEIQLTCKPVNSYFYNGCRLTIQGRNALEEIKRHFEAKEAKVNFKLLIRKKTDRCMTSTGGFYLEFIKNNIDNFHLKGFWYQELFGNKIKSVELVCDVTFNPKKVYKIVDGVNMEYNKCCGIEVDYPRDYFGNLSISDGQRYKKHEKVKAMADYLSSFPIEKITWALEEQEGNVISSYFSYRTVSHVGSYNYNVITVDQQEANPYDYGIANSFNWRGMEWAIIELIAENMKKKYQSLEITRIYNDYEDGTTFVDYRYYVPNPKVLEDI